MEIAGAVRVSDGAKRFLFWVDGRLAKRFIDQGLAEQRGTKRTIRALLWIGPLMEPCDEWAYPKVEPPKHHRSCKNPWNCC